MAAAATAERTIQYENLEPAESKLPLIIAVPEMATDQLVQIESAHFIGSVATGSLVEIPLPNTEKPTESLHDGLQRAANGDTTGRQLVRINARTDVIERTIKVGHVMEPVPLVITNENKIIQHGQTYNSVQANSLRIMANDPVMQPRTEAETRNGFRLEDLNRQRYFDNGYSFVVFSRAEKRPDVGFFTETMSCAIQVTAKQGDGLAVESAFVAGIKEPGGEQHDEATIVKVFAALGVDIAGKTPAEIIDTPLLIHNSKIPNGAIDLVKLYDDCADGTFFGETKPREDYIEYKQKCQLREQGFQPKVDKIVAELIAEASQITTPVMATERLHKISEKHMVEYAVQDATIDPRVFGPTAAVSIQQARQYQELGDLEAARKATDVAIKTAHSNSCPGAIGGTDGLDSLDRDEGNDSTGDCEFTSKECPKCHKKNVKTVVKNGRYHGDCGCKS